MTLENSRDAIDRWSRFVSYCSLVVAVCALAWTLFGFGTLPGLGDDSRDTFKSINASFEREAQVRNAQNEELREQWKQQQAEQLNAFTDAANELLTEHRQLVTRLQTASVAQDAYTVLKAPPGSEGTEGEDSTANVEEATAEEDAGVASTGVANTDVADTAEADIDLDSDLPPFPITPAHEPTEGTAGGVTPAATPPGQPLLAYVRESLKPTDDTGAAGLFTIRNRGGGEAVLQRVEFTPSFADDSVFEVDPALTALDTGADKDVLAIEFQPNDNLAADGGKHGVYARELTKRYVVPALGDVRLRLTVANSKHVGWGFHGSVKLEYNGIEPLTIEDAQLVFVAADDTIRRE